jgi:hypothetical protein
MNPIEFALRHDGPGPGKGQGVAGNGRRAGEATLDLGDAPRPVPGLVAALAERHQAGQVLLLAVEGAAVEVVDVPAAAPAVAAPVAVPAAHPAA